MVRRLGGLCPVRPNSVESNFPCRRASRSNATGNKRNHPADSRRSDTSPHEIPSRSEIAFDWEMRRAFWALLKICIAFRRSCVPQTKDYGGGLHFHVINPIKASPSHRIAHDTRWLRGALGKALECRSAQPKGDPEWHF